ncbi:MAG TPA: hypothetical protein VFV84_07455 [Burkholderiales bacterium]|nr:hypothetical protein [Burkholderiales bacterium]
MAPLRLELRPSRALAGAILGVHAAAALAVLTAVPGVPGAGLALVMLLLGARACRSRGLLAGSASLRFLEIAEDGSLTVELAGGRRVPGVASARRHLGPGWVVVPLAARPWVALVVGGMLAPDAFRRLRIWALWGRLPVAADPAGAG